MYSYLVPLFILSCVVNFAEPSNFGDGLNFPSGLLLKPSSSATSSPNKGYSSAIALKQEDESMAPTKSSGGVDDDHRVAASGTWRHEGTTTTATIIVGAKIITQESDPHHTHRSAYSYFSTFITTIYPSHAMVAIPTSPPMVTEVEENGQGRNDDGVAKQILSLLGPCDFACPSHAPL